MSVHQVYLFIFFIIYQLLSSHIEQSTTQEGNHLMNMSEISRSVGYSPRSILGYLRRSTNNTAKINTFTYKNCASNKSPIKFLRFNVVTSPSREITITMHANVSSTLRAPIKMISNIKKLTWIGWVTIPCVNNVGSCDIEDVCSLGTNKCPFKVGFPCSCPIKEGSYVIDNGVFPLPNIPLSSLLTGSYKVKLQVQNGANKNLGCVEATVDLQIT